MKNEPEIVAHEYWHEGADAWGEAHEFYNGHMPATFSTGWPSLDEFWKVRLGEMTILSGVPNHGKSTWLDALIVNLACMHDWRVAMFSPENQPLGVHAWHLIEKLMGGAMAKNQYDNGLTESQMVEAGQWMQKHLLFLNPLEQTVGGVLAAATKAYEAHPFEMMTLDPWAEFGDDRPSAYAETEWISISLSKFRRWARERGVHLVLVVHPRKLERDKNGKYPVPTAYDLAGSAHWRNKADNILCYWRDLGIETTEAEVYIQKVRFRFVGRVPPEPVQFVYSFKTRQFVGVKEANAGFTQTPPIQWRKSVKS